MTPEIANAIEKYINKPSGPIKSIYPAIDHIDFNYIEKDNPKAVELMVRPHQNHYLSGGWVEVTIWMKMPLEFDEDLWGLHEVDEVYLMDHHIRGSLYKLFNVRKNLPYNMEVYAPREENSGVIDSDWRLISVFREVEYVTNTINPDD